MEPIVKETNQNCGIDRDKQRVYGRCRSCQGLGVYFNVPEHSHHYLDGRPHEGHEVDFMADASLAPANPVVQVTENMAPPKVAQRITDTGFYYRLRSGGDEIGCYSVEDEEKPELDQTLASKLGVDLKEILASRLYEIRRPTTFDEVADVLGCTIRHDEANKLILLCAGLLTFTDQDQLNVLMSSESSSGKTYSALEVASYFPSEIVRTIGNASPTAFFHMEGEWDKENHLMRVDLRQKILIFLDQMHYSLQERLRPMLSHDRRELTYLITDKSKRGSLRTKKIILEGFPTAIFCAAKLSLDEQERTRVFILSPETSQEKLEESILLRIKHDGDRQAFKKWINTHPRRRWLKARIDAIRIANIDQIIIEDQEATYKRFLETHSRLAPRHQRDISRILALIKAHALLNWCNRERPQPNAIIASKEDVDAGFSLYGQVAKSNELGLSPQVYEIYRDIILPNLSVTDPLRKERIASLYYKTHGRHLPWKQLDRNILPALEASGLISLQPDPYDKRRIVVCHPDEGNISPNGSAQNNIAPIWGTQRQDTEQQQLGPNSPPVLCPPHAAHISRELPETKETTTT